MPIISLSEGIVTIQRYIRGHLARKHIRIRRTAPGVVRVDVTGNESLFARLISLLDSGRGDRTLHVLSIDPDLYQSHAVGGAMEFNPVASSSLERQQLLGRSQYNIFINGAFFNQGG